MITFNKDKITTKYIKKFEFAIGEPDHTWTEDIIYMSGNDVEHFEYEDYLRDAEEFLRDYHNKLNDEISFIALINYTKIKN